MSIDRYVAAGPVYDAISLEPLLYRRPRADLLYLLAPSISPGAVVIDIGCGTGLNFPALISSIGADGLLVGIDSSASMLKAANRRVKRNGWANVRLLHGDARQIAPLLDRGGVEGEGITAVVATFALSVMADDDPVWQWLRDLAARQQFNVGIADIGTPERAAWPITIAYDALTAIGGADPHRKAWEKLARQGRIAHERQYYGGHVHIAVGTSVPG
jgi:S-adenosylmethionine-diacylgycerolhomoserine-N-methlytransferase